MGMFSGIIRRSNSDLVKKEDLEVKLENFLSRYERNPEDYYIEDGKVNCKKSVYIFDDDLIDGKLSFKFGRVDGDFNCSGCYRLISLEGSPNSVDGDFDCNYCSSLISLEGAPNSIGGNFYYLNCNSLKSYKMNSEVDGKIYK